MAQTTVVEQVIEVASQLKDSILGLQSAYQQLPEIIEREHDAIKIGEFKLVAAACEGKEAVCERIEKLFSVMQMTGERLGKLVLSQWPDRPLPVHLTAYCDAINDLGQHLNDGSFASQVLNHVAKGVTTAVAEFMTLYLKIKAQIEANRYLLSNLMHNYQESYRFWQEVSEQVAVSYNSAGIQKAAGRNSGFRARA